MRLHAGAPGVSGRDLATVLGMLCDGLPDESASIVMTAVARGETEPVDLAAFVCAVRVCITFKRECTPGSVPCTALTWGAAGRVVGELPRSIGARRWRRGACGDAVPATVRHCAQRNARPAHVQVRRVRARVVPHVWGRMCGAACVEPLVPHATLVCTASAIQLRHWRMWSVR